MGRTRGGESVAHSRSHGVVESGMGVPLEALSKVSPARSDGTVVLNTSGGRNASGGLNTSRDLDAAGLLVVDPGDVTIDATHQSVRVWLMRTTDPDETDPDAAIEYGE